MGLYQRRTQNDIEAATGLSGFTDESYLYYFPPQQELWVSLLILRREAAGQHYIERLFDFVMSGDLKIVVPQPQQELAKYCHKLGFELKPKSMLGPQGEPLAGEDGKIRTYPSWEWTPARWKS